MNIKKIHCGDQEPHTFHRVNYVSEAEYELCVGLGIDGRWSDEPGSLYSLKIGDYPDLEEEQTKSEPYYEQMLLKIRDYVRPLGLNDSKQATDVMVRTLVEQYQDRTRRVTVLEEALERRNVRLREAEDALAEMKQADPLDPDGAFLPVAFAGIAHDALLKFLAGYEEYGPGAADECGLAGQWGDLHRKVAKLKKSMWSGEENLKRESRTEILQDIIGHCLLALEMESRGFGGGRK